MQLILNEGSVCELMYMMRDAMMEDNINVAIYISREIHDTLVAMKENKETVMCKIECEGRK